MGLRLAERLVGAVLVADLPIPDSDPAKVREVVREVLSRPEFQAGRPNPIERGTNWLLEELARALALLGQGGPGSVIGLVLFLLILAGVTILVVRFTRGLTRSPERAVA